ncbi:hypothetical protein GCM10010510_62660 [Streptomyces anandii JCM 4720]|nr:hypothetical protein GCM10010510_62660 [Streptomyces anandii JCM 4720]
MPDGRGTGGDPYRSALRAGEFLDPAHRLVDAPQALGHRRAQQPPRRGGRNPARLAFEQAEAQLPFETLHMLADGRLRTAQVTGGTAEGTGAADRCEDAKIVKCHETQA